MASTNLLPSSSNTLSPSRISTLIPSLNINSISKSFLSFSHSSASPSFRTSLSFTRPINPSLVAEQSRFVCRMCEYKFPDPIPEFAEAETEKFKEHMLARLTKKKQYFGDSVQEIVDICTEILNQFLRTEYGGPGTLLVIPFIDMAEAIKEKELPGSPQAARAAVVWAQNNIDKDWEKWNAED
ncbi:Serine/Threonine-kinase [Rhynchospora pubera]|uniref:Serine/Threonine-kinase n=2 Tax=Rhynchospora pubera TaxID=906938 RepID=A0AAV8GZD5_9POAL|nr:Serine/Threonine-kinase [Rhynchospora pubera]KAJ4811033.1 Serine/Threonine-kinase [Rhynchospora pubera]